MRIGKIWQRYILWEFLKIFLLFLAGFYLLYVVIDYSSHMQDFLQGKNLPLWKVTYYYLLQFVKRSDILLPLALLVSSIKVLCQLNINKELVAFQTAGLKIRQLLTPLFFMGVICALANLTINEFLLPHSLNSIDKFYDSHLRHSYRGKRTEPLHVIQLEDHSKLVYQTYDHSKNAFFDVLWIRNPEDIWKIKYLKTDPKFPLGDKVDHLVRNSSGEFEKKESFSIYLFENLTWNDEIPRKGYIPFENRSIRELGFLFFNDPHLSHYEKQELLTQLLFKSVMPSLSILVLISIAPYCLAYQRNIPQFFIYAFGIFGFIAFIAFMDAAVILGENETISPYFAILIPFTLLFSLFSWRFKRIQ